MPLRKEWVQEERANHKKFLKFCWGAYLYDGKMHNSFSACTASLQLYEFVLCDTSVFTLIFFSAHAGPEKKITRFVKHMLEKR